MSITNIENIVQHDFQNFLFMKDKQITQNTINRYLKDINYYIERYVANSTIVDKFDNFFSFKLITTFLNTRKSSTARATIRNFLIFLHEFERLSDFKYIELNSFLDESKKTNTEKQMEFLTNEQLSYLLKGHFFYKKDEKEASIVLPLLISLSYNLLFEQEHLMKIRWSDIQIDSNRIRNLRSDNEELAATWININDDLRNQIVEYSKHYPDSVKDDFLLKLNGEALNNNGINILLRVLQRVQNRKILKAKVDIQKLYRSRIYKELVDSEGQAAIYFIKNMGLKRTTQLEHALEEYLLNENSKMSSDF